MCDCDTARMSLFILLPREFISFDFMRLLETENAFLKFSLQLRLLLLMGTFDFRLIKRRHPTLL